MQVLFSLFFIFFSACDWAAEWSKKDGFMGKLNLSGKWWLNFGDGEKGNIDRLKDCESPRARLEASVPGEVHLEAMRAGWARDLEEGLNVLEHRWIEECAWTYRKSFEAPAAARRQGARAWLYFAQLDGAARVFLNGELIATHANDFRPLRVEVSRFLRTGKNDLRVVMDSGISDATEKPGKRYNANFNALATRRPWLRKIQNQFSWDWAPRLINIGIGGDVSLEWSESPVRLDRLVPLVELAKDLKTALVRVRAHIEVFAATTVRLDAVIAKLGVQATIEKIVFPGEQIVEVEFTVENPPLWWPRGQGVAKLFDIEMKVSGKGFAETAKRKIGFRRVEVCEDPHPVEGNYFYLLINNRPVFIKGGNLVPADLIRCRVDSARYRKLVKAAEDLNFNFLRVWGGGQYETDVFYDLCDVRGIMVWQEPIFACTKYPLDDKDFLEECKREVRWNARRLAGHPSLVLWCGNNEMELGYWHWGWDREGAQIPDHGFFHITLPRLLQEEDPTVFYWPSSPYSRDCVSPGSHTTGDQHPWELGFIDNDFRKYRKMVCRFPNEGGSLGSANLQTIRKCLPAGMESRNSLAWALHDNSIAFWSEPAPQDTMVTDWLGLDASKFSIEDYCLASGFLQGEALREYVENFHRRKYSTGSAVFWMFNEIWPALRSWTTMDWQMRPNPSWHPVRRAMENIVVVVTENDKGEAEIFGVNDTPQPWSGKLRFGIFTPEGKYLCDETIEIVLPANESLPIANLGKTGKRKIAFARLDDQAGQLVSRSRTIKETYKELGLRKSKISTKKQEGKTLLHSQSLVLGVCTDLEGKEVADNFFDLWPGQDYSIAGTVTPLRTLNDMLQPQKH